MTMWDTGQPQHLTSTRCYQPYLVTSPLVQLELTPMSSSLRRFFEPSYKPVPMFMLVLMDLSLPTPPWTLSQPPKPVLRYNVVLAFFQASLSLPWCVRDPQRADPKTTPVPSQDLLATLSSSSHTFDVIGMVGRSPSVLCPVHGLVVLQLLGRLRVVSEARDDFCGIILEGRPPLALRSMEGSMHKQADKTEGQ